MFCKRKSGKETHINISKFGGLSQDWVDGKHCLCVSGSFLKLWGEKHKQNPQKSRDNPVNIFAYIFLFSSVFFRSHKWFSCFPSGSSCHCRSKACILLSEARVLCLGSVASGAKHKQRILKEKVHLKLRFSRMEKEIQNPFPCLQLSLSL